MKIKKTKSLILLSTLLVVAVTGCNSGGGTSGPKQDIQLINAESGINNVVAGSASNCRQIPLSGSCTVDIAYHAESTSIYNGFPGLVNLPNGYSSNVGNCPTSSTQSSPNYYSTCTITITHTSGAITNAVNIGFSLNSNMLTGGSIPTFILGGGY